MSVPSGEVTVAKDGQGLVLAPLRGLSRVEAASWEAFFLQLGASTHLPVSLVLSLPCEPLSVVLHETE